MPVRRGQVWHAGRPAGGTTLTETHARGRGRGGSRQWTVPGRSLGKAGSNRAGAHVGQREDDLIAISIGFVGERGGEISVDAVKGRYVPASGDLIIGVVSAVQGNMWILNVAGPFDAILPMSLAPWKVEYGDARRHMDVGDAILARVQEVDETHRVVCTMKGMGLRKLQSGMVEEISPVAAETLTRGGGQLLARLKDASGSRLIAAQNGRVWIDGAVEGIQWAREALQVVHATAHMPGLAGRIGALEARAPTSLLEEG